MVDKLSGVAALVAFFAFSGIESAGNVKLIIACAAFIAALQALRWLSGFRVRVSVKVYKKDRRSKRWHMI